MQCKTYFGANAVPESGLLHPTPAAELEAARHQLLGQPFHSSSAPCTLHPAHARVGYCIQQLDDEVALLC